MDFGSRNPRREKNRKTPIKLSVRDERRTIGNCAPTQGAVRRASAEVEGLPLSHSQSQKQPPYQPQTVRLESPSSKKMKGLFKPKPRTPVDVVRQTRELLMFADRSTDTRESKREDKVRFFSYPI